VRIVNSPELWDNRVKVAYRSKYFGQAYLSMLALLIIGAMSVLDIQVHRQLYAAPNHHNAISSTKPSDQLQTISKLEKDLSPEQDNPSTFLLQKLATPPPPPPADCQVDSCLALTFDDGPGADSTPIILSALEKAQVHASFFVLGYKVAPNADILRRIHADGSDIGDHSWTHPDFTKIPEAQVQQQVDMTQAAIAATGIPAPYLLRPPYGSINQTILSHINMPTIMWNVDPKDWAQKDPNAIAQIVEAQAKPGGIIVMHDKPLTAAAIDKIVTDLKDKYRLVTVSQLLGLNPDSRGIYFGR
jgi:peptidoglycan/xylan/chitin deacetylase (PgdA/CDA1 family)